MSFINWGHESPEQRAIRRKIEEDYAIFEQRAVAVSAAAAAAGSGRIKAQDPSLNNYVENDYIEDYFE